MGGSAAVSTGLAKHLMPVPDPHPDVFDRQWPLRPTFTHGGLHYGTVTAPRRPA